MSRTPLTTEQYSELTRALEYMRSIYAAGDCPSQPQQCLRDMWSRGIVSAWCMVYLVQWFGIVGQNSTLIPNMVAELCEERC